MVNEIKLYCKESDRHYTITIEKNGIIQHISKKTKKYQIKAYCELLNIPFNEFTIVDSICIQVKKEIKIITQRINLPRYDMAILEVHQYLKSLEISRKWDERIFESSTCKMQYIFV